MNKVILIGNLTRDPELSETPSGVAVCHFSVAVKRIFPTATARAKRTFSTLRCGAAEPKPAADI